MARDHARVNIDIWTDDDWRDLTHDGQWLYLNLVTGRSLSFAGMADWRPARIAALTRDLEAADVERFAIELIDERFILPDPDTEEVLIRSFVKWDGLMRTPNIAKAMARDHGHAGSSILRSVFVDQMCKFHEKEPGLSGWNHAGDLLERRRMTFEEGVTELFGEPSNQPSDQGSGKGSDQPLTQRREIRRLLRSPFSVLQSPSSSSVTYPPSPGEQPKAANA